MNHSDSERISGFLEAQGHKPAQGLSEAALVIFNTCGVRQMAEDRVYGQVRNARLQGPKIKIILTGCLANRPDVQKRLRDKVDLFFPINNFNTFENFVIENSLKIVNFKLKISARGKNTSTNESITYLSITPKLTNKFQASVPIMTGCNNFCAYCVVPFARGRETSRPASEIISEVRALVKKGYKEIVLLGQNVNSYKSKVRKAGKSIKQDEINFSDLLKKIDAISGNIWINFISNHPKDVTDEMIETVAQSQKVCECFHLPLQAGNDTVLQNMNRKYTQKEYLTLVKKIKAAYKKYKPEELYSITTDIIVGFPGETKKQFLDSAEVMKKVGYDMVFFGQFSPRPGTAAWQMKDDVSKTEKSSRAKYLNEILKKTSLANNRKYISKIIEILIESEKDGAYFGRTRTMKNVKLKSTKKNLVGKIVKSEITKANIWNLEGTVRP